MGATALRVWLAWYDHSVFWPDEIHQSLEQAHRAAFGYGLVPWEFRDGARSWLFPGLIAALWKLAAGVGVDSSLALVLLARLAMVAGSVTAIWLAAKLAARSHGSRAALAVVVILATFPPSVVFAYRAMSETASAPLIVLGAWLLWQRSERAALYAGLAIAAATLLRYQNGLFAIVFALVLLPQRRYREALAFCSMGVAVALFGGLLDWVTWGSPFHSLIAYFDFNLVTGGASDFGVEPFAFYATTLWSSVGPMLLPLAVLFAIGALAEPILGGTVAIYVLAHSALPHKELRFLVPCFPLFAAVAGIGVERVLRRVASARWVSAISALGATAAFGYSLVDLEYLDMGQYAGTERASFPVWRSEQEPTLLLADAGEQPDLCGVAVLGARAGFSGAYTYLHRDVPLMYHGELCDAGAANYVIRSTRPGAVDLPPSYSLQSERGHWGLYRRDGGCRAPLREDDRLLEGARDMGLQRRQARQASDGSLRFDLERDAGAFVESWGHGELLECDMARWAAGKRAAIEFDFHPSGTQYQLNLRARSHEHALPQTLAVSVNGEVQRVGRMTPKIEPYSVDLPDDALRDGRNRIEFLFSRAAPPAGNDARHLTALFRAIEILPKQDDFLVDVALTESRSHLVRGFNASEQEGGMTFVWSEGLQSEVEGSLAWPRSPYVLQTLAEAVPLVPSQRTRVFANDQFVGTLTFAKKWDLQRLLIPAAALRRGNNTIRFEYEHAAKPSAFNRKLHDDRALAVRFRQIQLTPVTATASVDVGTPEARPFLLDGWSGDERDGSRNAAWTDGPRASVLLSLAGVVQPVLRLSAQGYSAALPIAVTVSLNGNPVGAFAAPDGWQNIAVPLPAGDYSPAGDLLELKFDHTLRPSVHNAQSNDSRQLALRVDRIWVESEAAENVNAMVRSLKTERGGMPRGVAATR